MIIRGARTVIVFPAKTFYPKDQQDTFVISGILKSYSNPKVLSSAMTLAPFTVQDLQNKYAAGEPFTLLDVRLPSEVQIVALPGAINIPLDMLAEAFDTLDPAEDIIVFCHHGVRSAQAAAFLRQKGFEAFSLQGGIHAWAKDIDKSMATY